MLSTPQLAWLDLRAGRKQRIVEWSHCGVALLVALSNLLVSFYKVMRILHIVKTYTCERISGMYNPFRFTQFPHVKHR